MIFTLLSLFFLILLSAFFSSSETGIMSLNRYRLQHLVRKKNTAAQCISQLLTRPDRLLGMILIGNTFANILASALATVLAIHWWGEWGVMLGTIVLTLIVLIFAEITPKTLAAIYPEKVAFFVAWPLKQLLTLCYPLVWLANALSNGLLRLFRVDINTKRTDALSHEELQTLLTHFGSKLANTHQNMLLRILELEKVSVDDVMVPRHEIQGIDLAQDWPSIIQKLTTSPATYWLVYQESINQVTGLLTADQLLNSALSQSLNKHSLHKNIQEVPFIPKGTPLAVQLLNFRQQQCRVGVIVDEYGDVQGLVTLDDILEEIVGDLSSDLSKIIKKIQREKDGSYLIHGSLNVRELNRLHHWNLPTDGAKTLSGLIIETLATIPSSGICLKLGDYPVEVLKVASKKIIQVRLLPKIMNKQKTHHN